MTVNLRVCALWNFYPRPPRGGRLNNNVIGVVVCLISIHALREEGDFGGLMQVLDEHIFLSTPSARRATG